MEEEPGNAKVAAGVVDAAQMIPEEGAANVNAAVAGPNPPAQYVNLHY